MALELTGLSPTIVKALEERSGGTAAGIKGLDPSAIAKDLKVDIEDVRTAQNILTAVLERSSQVADVVHVQVQQHLAATSSTQGDVGHGGKRLAALPSSGLVGGDSARFEIDRPLDDGEHRRVAKALELLSGQPKLLEKLVGPGWRMTTSKPHEGGAVTYFDGPGAAMTTSRVREGDRRILIENKLGLTPDGLPLLAKLQGVEVKQQPSTAEPLLKPTLEITSRRQEFVFENVDPKSPSYEKQFNIEIQTQKVRHLEGPQANTETTHHHLSAEGAGQLSGVALQIFGAIGAHLTAGGSNKAIEARKLGLI